MYLQKVDQLIPHLNERKIETAPEKIRRSLTTAARKAALDLLEREYRNFTQESPANDVQAGSSRQVA